MSKLVVTAMARTGHWAIANWIEKNSGGKYKGWKNRENQPIEDTCNISAKDRRDILVVRDPWNWWASLIKTMQEGAPNHNLRGNTNWLKQAIEKWVGHVKEYVGDTNMFGEGRVLISYNKWFTSCDYRSEIADQLDLVSTDKDLNKVAHPTCRKDLGSSFDSFEYQGRAQEMDTLNRWQGMQDDPLWPMILDDSRVASLGKRAFGFGKPVE